MQHAPRLEPTALVVDDDVFMVSALAELLDDHGFDVHTATNGFSALRRVVAARPSIILLDVALPERSGTELLADLRADPGTRDLAVVLVTAYADRLSGVEVEQADGVVAKPFDIDELLATLQRAMQLAAGRRAEVAPVAAASHGRAAARARRSSSIRRTRGRR